MNYLKRYILIAVALFVPQLSFCQYQNKLFDIDSSSDGATSVKLRSDGSLFVLESATSNHVKLATSIYIGGAQSMLQNHVFSNDSFSYNVVSPGSLKSLSNGRYLSGLSLVAPSSAFSQYTSRAAVAKFTSAGDTIFIKSYTDTSTFDDTIEDIDVAANGDIYLAGWERTPWYYAISKGLIIKTDSNGNFKWSKTFQYPNKNGHHVIRSIQVLPDGRLLICAAVYEHVVLTSLTFSYDRKVPWVFIADTSGNILKERFFPSRYGGDNALPAIYKDANGGYYLYGSLDSFVTSNPYDFSNFPAYIAHFDSNFNETWLTTFADPVGSYNINTVKQLHDNSYLLVGGGTTTTHYPYRGWAVKVNKYGWVLWNNIYAYDSTTHDELFDAVEKQDGSIILCGTNIDHTLPQWRQYDVWLLGLDANGCAVPGCTPTAVPPTITEGRDFKLYPNPTTGLIDIESPEQGTLYLTNIQGQQVAQFSVGIDKTRLQLPATLSTGIYIGRFVANNSGNSSIVRIVYNP